jgi:hypothetical protein
MEYLSYFPPTVTKGYLVAVEPLLSRNTPLTYHLIVVLKRRYLEGMREGKRREERGEREGRAREEKEEREKIEIKQHFIYIYTPILFYFSMCFVFCFK